MIVRISEIEVYPEYLILKEQSTGTERQGIHGSSTLQAMSMLVIQSQTNGLNL